MSPVAPRDARPGRDPPRRILLRLPTWVGDAVLATPALRALRATWPRAEIALEGRPALADLLRGLPSHDVFLADDPRRPGGLFARTRALRAGGFDWAVLLPDSVRAALAPAWAGIPRRVGYARDPLRRALVTEALVPERRGRRREPVPMTLRYLGITRYLGCPDRGERPELVVDPGAAERVEKELARRGVGPDAGILLVTPGASFGPSKLWPPGHFAAACDGIARAHGLRPVLAPGPGETERAAAVEVRMREPVVRLGEPPLHLSELVALVARARLLVTNDTGPRHVASALSIPAVVAMGPTDPRITFSRVARERVLRTGAPCSPCQLRRCPVDGRCLTRLEPERAVAAAAELLA